MTESKREVLIFTASSCLPCKQLKSHLASCEGINDYIRYICMDNTDEDNNTDYALARKYGVSKAPTVIYFQDGEAVSSSDGYSNKTVNEIKKFLS